MEKIFKFKYNSCFSSTLSTFGGSWINRIFKYNSCFSSTGLLLRALGLPALFKYNSCFSSTTPNEFFKVNVNNLNTTLVSLQLCLAKVGLKRLWNLNTTLVSLQRTDADGNKLSAIFKYNSCFSSTTEITVMKGNTGDLNTTLVSLQHNISFVSFQL